MAYIENLVFEIAKETNLAHNFRDIRIIHDVGNDEGQPIIAFTDVRNKILFLNVNRVSEEMVLPLMTHEVAHIDRRLKAPKGMENFYEKEEKKDDNLHMVLNYVFDMKIHQVYGRVIPQSYSFLLQKFLTKERNEVIKKDKENLILSLIYPRTPLQKAVKKILFDKKLSDLEKAKAILKLLKKNGSKSYKEQQTATAGRKSMGISEKGTKRPSKSIDRLTHTGTEVIINSKHAKEIKEGSRSVKNEIKEAEDKIKELKEKLSALGYSGEQFSCIMNEVKADNVDYLIKNLDGLKDIFVMAEKSYTNIKEKKKKDEKEYGKLIGYRRMKDITELAKNPVDLVLLSNYDLNGVRIPKLINNRTRTTNIVIIRDISGSLSGEPANSIVRDTIIGTLQLCKKFHYKVGLIEFHSESKVITGTSKEELGTDYETLMVKSLFNKYGDSTCLSLAIKDLNNLIGKYKLFNENINVIIITDRFTDEAKRIECNHDKLKLIVLSTDRRESDGFKKFMELHKNKKEFFITNVQKDGRNLVLENM